MNDTVILYIKVITAVLVGWKLGELERKIEDIIDELNAQRKKKEHQ